jgi:hypothetical protein
MASVTKIFAKYARSKTTSTLLKLRGLVWGAHAEEAKATAPRVVLAEIYNAVTGLILHPRSVVT